MEKVKFSTRSCLKIQTQTLLIQIYNLLSSFQIFQKLDNTTADFLDRNISEGENVLKGMKNNKSPGSDGFTAEFYNFFWNDLYIKNAMNHIFMHGHLSVSQRL